MEAPGIEPVNPTAQAKAAMSLTETTSLPLAHSLAREPQIDPDLARLIEAWPTLPEALRAGILAMVAACSREA